MGLIGALGWTVLALARGETVNAILFVFAGVATYFIGYRFYSKFIEHKIAKPNDRRATPAEYKANGSDYVVTDRRVVYGHHFAAIAGAGPLVGPVLAAQWGFLPGTIWIIVGVIIAGAVQDYLVLYFSMRRCRTSARSGASTTPSRIATPAVAAAELLAFCRIRRAACPRQAFRQNQAFRAD